MKKFFILFLAIIILLLLAISSQAAEPRPLEIIYPEIETFEPETVTTPIPEYVRYIFNFFIWIAGIIALLVLANAGFGYFTSAGNPEKIRESKDQIAAALLGLLILFGSYLILIFINPGLVIFHLPRIKPIISTLPPGVLVCKKPVQVDEAWALKNNFPHEPDWRQDEIAKELDKIFEDISDNCYSISNEGDIRSDFDNKVTDIYFIPEIKMHGGEKYLSLHGAILYEDRDYRGKSQSFHEHFEYVAGVFTPEHPPIKISNPSSIKPFQLLWRPDPNWVIVLYQKPNFNKGFALDPEHFWLDKAPCGGHDWWCDINLSTFFSWSPESIKIEGDLLVVLFTSDGKSTTFSENDHNLLDDINITKEECDIVSGSFGGVVKSCRTLANATRLLILSASIY